MMNFKAGSVMRFLEAHAEVESTERLSELVEKLGQPVHWHGKRTRGLNPCLGPHTGSR